MNNPTTASRRRFLAAGSALAGLAVLTGCGFELRKAPVFAFKSLSLPGRSAFTVYLPPERAKDAEAVLDILGENRERVVLSTNAAGEVRELELRLTVRFRLRTQAGKELLVTDISQKRDLTYSETNALAKEGEAELLYRDMQNDVAQQMLRRIAAVKEL
jgi:LPS-assembly lipoprotein